MSHLMLPNNCDRWMPQKQAKSGVAAPAPAADPAVV